jgi:hypothetical protein
MTNYRPISLFTTFSKVLEKVMYNKLSHKMHTNNILVPEQFDFRKGLSTENAEFILTDNILKAINQKCLLEENLWSRKSFWPCKLWNLVG